ncbi:hypothetical protein CBL21_21080, partial [Shigella flexneri]
QKQKKLIMLPSETMIWQPEFTDKTLSRKPGAVHFSPSNWLPNSRDLAASCLAETLMNCTRYPGKQHIRPFTGSLVY